MNIKKIIQAQNSLALQIENESNFKAASKRDKIIDKTIKAGASRSIECSYQENGITITRYKAKGKRNSKIRGAKGQLQQDRIRQYGVKAY
jgi:hypothetical protein